VPRLWFGQPWNRHSIPDRARDFCVLWRAQSGCGSHPVRGGDKADCPLPSNAEFKKEWSYTATPPYAFMAGTCLWTFTVAGRTRVASVHCWRFLKRAQNAWWCARSAYPVVSSVSKWRMWSLALTNASSFCTAIWASFLSSSFHFSDRRCHLMTRLKTVTGSGSDDSSDVRYFLKRISRLLVCDAASLGCVRRFVRLSMKMKKTHRRNVGNNLPSNADDRNRPSQRFSNSVTGVPLTETGQFQCTAILFCIEVKKVKWERLAEYGHELYSVASSTAC
jgi:hypothetical protein